MISSIVLIILNLMGKINTDESVELRDEQKELLKDTAIYDSMLTKAKTLLQKVADVCGYPNYDIPVELYSEIADFIKNSED